MSLVQESTSCRVHYIEYVPVVSEASASAFTEASYHGQVLESLILPHVQEYVQLLYTNTVLSGPTTQYMRGSMRPVIQSSDVQRHNHALCVT